MQDLSDQDYFDGTRFVFDAASGKTSVDATFLIASLLVSAAKGDGSISQLETETMLDRLVSRLGMRNAEAMEYLSAAVMELTNETDITLRLHQLSGNLSQSEKESVFSLVLDIVMVDGQLDPGESLAVINAGQILGLSQDKIHSELRALTKK